MQYVNDDMDDVFRRAAKNYPLDTSGADWNKVLAGLQGQDDIKVAKKKDQRRYLWLLMLLPLGLVCNYYYDNNDKGKRNLKGDNAEIVNAENASPEIPQTKYGNSDKSKIDIVAGENGNEPRVVAKAGSVNVGTSGSLLGATSKDMAVLNTVKKVKPASNNNYNNQQSGFAISNNINFTQQTSSNVSNEETPLTASRLNSEKTSSYTGFINHSKTGLPAISVHPATQFDGVSNESGISPGLKTKPQRFYLGLMGGIDKTTIESQKASQTGFDYGMLAGYKIGRKWAVEAGAFMDKKYYYTQGKYFKNDGIYMPPNTWITDVDGSCRMWDFSIGGSYSVLQNKKSGLFVATGMSSYIMKEENYDYTYYYAGSGTSAVHSKTYYKESKDLFSIINLSVGYTHHLGKISDLRVEPYMKIPVQGVGVGNLSLFSAGIHIGITGKLF